VLKALEQLGKTLLALFAAGLLFRPGRRRRAVAALGAAKKVLLVRIDNRVGEALLTTPLLDALAERKDLEVHLLVHAQAARVLEGHPSIPRLIALDRRLLAFGAWAPGLAPLRREGYDVVVDCSNWTAPSVTAALVARLAGPRAVVLGPGAFPVTLLQDVSVAARPDTRSEVEQRLNLLSPLLGAQPHRALSFRAPRGSASVDQFLSSIARPYAVVNPGGRLGFRRVPAQAFGAAASALAQVGHTPVITWGPGEETLAAEVLRLAPGAVLAPPTTIDELAALMKGAAITVCNNTGPMHLSVAVGTPTLAFFLRMEMERWGHPHSPHRMVDLTPVIEANGDLSAEAARAVRDLVVSRRAEQRR
jgi:ADP-heptose:LPS heptosyltransferase